jgi:hypothetical protein
VGQKPAIFALVRGGKTQTRFMRVFVCAFRHFDATAKSPKNLEKTMPTSQNQGGKVLLTLASLFQ